MKKSSLVVVTLLLAAMIAPWVKADNINAKLINATVYQQGASLTHTTTASLKSGSNDIVIEGLSPIIDATSLKITASNGIIIAASEFSVDYLSKQTETKELTQLRDSLKIYQKQQQQLETSIKINQQMLDVLTNGVQHNMDNKEKHISTADITANLELYRQKAHGLINDINRDNDKLTETNKRIKALSQQINQDKRKQIKKQSGILHLVANAPLNTNCTFTISYFTQAASWSPCYDINIIQQNAPVQLRTKAKVQQTTGLDWEHVKLTLSNAKPNRNTKAPIFSTWFLDYRYPQQRSATVSNSILYTSKANKMVAMSVSDSDEIFVEEAAESAYVPDPVWVIDGVVFPEYPESLDNSMIASSVFKDGKEAQRLYGSIAAGGATVITTKTMNDFVEVDTKSAAVNYVINMPYNVPGNGKAQNIDLKEYNIQADYYHYTAPKLQEQCFLMATLKNWEQLNLLSGEAIINYQGTFVGTTMLNTNTTKKELNLSLLADEQVSVKREKQSDLTSTKTVGNTTTTTQSYLITVKNNKTESVKLTVKDQYPISSQKEIEVKVVELTPEPTHNITNTGVVTWETELKAGESKQFTITYSVKYNKDKRINL